MTDIIIADLNLPQPEAKRFTSPFLPAKYSSFIFKKRIAAGTAQDECAVRMQNHLDYLGTSNKPLVGRP
ncbi:MAG TPA: hypothetical protein VEG25_09345 [Burkholderiales bacterium]|nr:hypothetical protein [Burkholderiales bacterium]